MGAAFEDELCARDGMDININDDMGNMSNMLMSREPKKGQDIRVTINALLQQTAYDHFTDEKGAAAAMNLVTAEVQDMKGKDGSKNVAEKLGNISGAYALEE